MQAVLNTWLSYWTVYVDNLSLFYIVSVAVSFLAVFVSWWSHSKNVHNSCKKDEIYDSNNEEQKEKDTNIEDINIVREYRKARQNAIERKILSTFTAEQLEEERKAEREQLAAIFQLLKEEKEKFQVNSMEELESQFKLYRP